MDTVLVAVAALVLGVALGYGFRALITRKVSAAEASVSQAAADAAKKV